MPTQQSKADSSELALFKQIAEGSSESVVVLTSEQEGITVSREESGFETVKSQRFVLSEKKLLRQRLESMEATAQKADEKNSILALVEGHNDCQSDGQSKGEEVQENFSMATQVVDTQPTSKSRRKTTTSHRGRDNVVQTTKDKKTKFKQTKQSAQTSGPKAKEYKQVPAKTAVESEKTSHTKMKQPVSPAKPTGQVAGEAPAESPISKKRPQYVKVASTTDTQRGQKPRSEKQTQGNSTRDQKASFSSATGSKRTQTHSNRQGAALTADSAERVKKALTAKPRDRVAKARSKQVRQVYVVKTPAPSTASSGAMSTAA
ncbi:Hypothetical protein PHPALM_10434 [Phytophthora palmivora]|uniref:Uncharacterized protein n=1 Tax=Phytophthora palmivora TaxID=4796 RepID=A0A2P4Y4S4_9STRA|nr:Hypothetical protein PHPALM_10434 [Phytophthora palmivora]